MSDNQAMDILGEIAADAIFIPTVQFSNETTFGTWRVEKDSADAFDLRAEELERRGYWRMHREIAGEYIQPRMVSDECRTECRADRILIPRPKLIELGWPHGPIGVEIEPGYVSVAKPLIQAEGYSRAVFHLENGFHVTPEWWFVWCWDGGKGNLASVAAQKRIGGVWGSGHSPLMFDCGSVHGIVWRANGTVEAKRLPMGCKAGHRNGVKR